MLQFMVPFTCQNEFKEYKTRALSLINNKDAIIFESNACPEFLQSVFEQFE